MPVDMGPQFSQLLAFDGNTVIAMGPLGEADTKVPDYVEQIHAWIYQEVDLTADAVAIPTGPVDAEVLQRAGDCWMLPLESISSAQGFKTGRAFAVAIAMFSNVANRHDFHPIPDKKGHVIWWAHPVQLLNSPDAVEMATSGEYKENPGTAFAAITGILESLWEQRQADTQ